MIDKTKIVRRVTLLASAVVSVAAFASPAFARGDYVVHIDIPEIGNSPGGGGNPNHIFEWSDFIGLEDEPAMAPVGPIAGDPQGPGPGNGFPTLVVDPFQFDESGLAPDTQPGYAPGAEPVGVVTPVSPVPSPGGAVLLGLGAVSFAGRRRR